MPGVAVAPAVAVSLTELPALTVDSLNAAVTSAGTPDTARLTVPLKLFSADTFTVLLTLAPPARAVRLAGEEDIAKLETELIRTT